MAEAEDVVTDIARHATVFSQRLWKKYRPSPSEDPKITLKDVAERLNLLILSAFNVDFSLRAAQTPIPPTLLARSFRRIQHPWTTHALPTTDGKTIWLPFELHLIQPTDAKRLYRIMALQQAVRAQRNSFDSLESLDNPVVRDVFHLLEAYAADERLIKTFPGLKPDLLWFRRTVLSRRPAIRTFSTMRQPLETFYRELLTETTDGSPNRLALLGSSQDCVTKAIEIAEHLMKPQPRFTVRAYSAAPLVKDWWTGEMRSPSSSSLVETFKNANSNAHERPARSAQLPRRPDVRDATEEEERRERKNDDAWMVQGDESHPKAEDPMGLQRPIDRDTETSAEEFADLVSELPQARLVSTTEQSKEVLSSDEPPDKRSQIISSSPDVLDELSYPEWDYQQQGYRIPGAKVCIRSSTAGSQQWVDTTLAKHRSLINIVKRQFELLRAQPTTQRKQFDGEDIDLDAYITSYSDYHSGDAFDDAIYQTRRINERNAAVSILIDVSGSTDSWIANQRRVIDVEREALLLVSIALQSLDLPWAITAFSGEGPQAVSVREVKNYKETFGNDIALRISSLEPERFTRVGAAVRHATAEIMKVPAAQRLLIVLSDGKPNDLDNYEGRYGIEDTRQAVIEARNQNIHPFCLTIDKQAAHYLPYIFGPQRYALLPHPEKLPGVLLQWMKRLLTC